MKFRSLAMKILPGGIADLYHHFKQPHRSGYWFEGIYENYQDVLVSGEGWNSDTWIKSRTEFTRDLLLNFSNNCSAPFEAGERFNLLGVVIALLRHNKEKIKILDFGGAMGIAYVYLLANLVDVNDIEYYVVDNQRSCIEGEKIFKDYQNIHFYNDLSDVPERFDIIFSSGTLQHIGNYIDVIQKLCSYRAEYILYTYISAGTIPTFPASLRHLKRSILLNWFFNQDEIHKLMDDNGYRLIYKSLDPGELDMNNYPEKYRISHMSNLLFSIKTPV